jgi:hypothetical protein
MKSQLLAVVLALLGSASALAQTSTVPVLLSYQGRVTDSAGNLIGSSTPVNRAVKFQLYTVSSGGTPVWAETQTVTISGGEFSVLIGNGTGISDLTGPSSPAPTPYKKIPEILNASGNTSAAFYLGVTVDDGNSATTDAEISPRQQLVAGAYALRATVAETVASGAVTTAMIADSTVTTGKLADSGVTSAKIADNSVATADLAANSVTAAKIDANTVGLWSVNGGNVYRSGGNVGIGISSPNSPLHVIATANGAPDANGIYVYNSSNSAGNHATVAVRTAGASGGSPFFSMDVAGVNGWAMGLDNADGQKFKISNAWNTLSTNPKLTITPAGNVGIGQTNPGFPLSFADALGDKITLFGQGTSHYGFGIQGALLQIHSESSGADIAFGYGSSANFTERMRVKGNGHVGIGTNSPGGPLHINETNGTAAGATIGTLTLQHQNQGGASSIVFPSRNNYGNDYAYIQYQDDSSIGGGAETSRLIIATQNDGDDNIVLNPSGYVGIKTMNPVYPLDVRSYATTYYYDSGSSRSDSGQYYQEGNPDIYSADGTKGINGNPNLSIYAEKGVSAQFFLAHSDQRIKNVVSRSDSSEDLRLINLLQVTDYTMKDRVGSGAGLRKGLIAQEVAEVMPEAVDRSVNYVPDVYALAARLDYNPSRRLLTVVLEKEHKLAVGDWVRVLADSETLEVVVSETPSAYSFVVQASGPAQRAFVYGRRVDDFLSVDYDRVFNAGISAIQELSARLEERDARIDALEARLVALEKLLTSAK